MLSKSSYFHKRGIWWDVRVNYIICRYVHDALYYVFSCLEDRGGL